MWVGTTADRFSEKRFKERIRFVSIIFAIGFTGILLRLFYLQVMKGDDFALVSESNRTQTIFLGAPRGNFFDRNNKPLVTNRPSWSLMYSGATETDLTQENMVRRLRPFLESFTSRWERRLKQAFKSKQLVRLMEDVPTPTAFGIRETGDLLPGLRMEMEFRRDYPNGIQGIQLLGYLAEIDDQELKDDFWFARKSGDLIGKMGLEKILDSQLRGHDGGMLIEVDSVGRLKRVIRELPYQRGSSIHLTLDSHLQRVAQDALAETSTQRGAVVLMDVETGAVLTWVSSPAFDPSVSLAEVVTDANLPFFDRVYKGAYPPGSLFKIITAMAALESGLVRTKDKVKCLGHITLKDKRLKERRYGCWRRHGVVDFWKAMSESCDSYFYTISQKIGSQAIYEMGSRFGLGEPVQDALPGENPGVLPNPSWKRKRGLGGWSTGDTLNFSIGQGFLTSTPLQMAVMMAGLSTHGKTPRPYVISRIYSEAGITRFETRPSFLKPIKLKSTTWENILDATRMVVEKGTGKASAIPYLVVHGKTGTAQNPHGNDHAWFLAAAGYPHEPLKYSVCVFVENGGNGGSAAAPIARRVLKAALPPRSFGETL
ncbi:penicillin-binding protein 2 [bacterium F11]|nr:penicillin-binding protein 2 [bacterium F11]